MIVHDKEQLKKEYEEYSIFDRDTYTPIINDRKKDSTYDGIVGFNLLGLKVNFSRVFIYKNIYYNWENNTKDIFYGVNFSEEIKFVQENLKKSNKIKLMKAPIKKIVFNSIYSLSQFAEMLSFTINNKNNIITGISTFDLPITPNTWYNCLGNYCK